MRGAVLVVGLIVGAVGIMIIVALYFLLCAEDPHGESKEQRRQRQARAQADAELEPPASGGADNDPGGNGRNDPSAGDPPPQIVGVGTARSTE